ncbi:MAG: AI-2E family transporter [Candidatus Parcubacteria bacterium]|nr:MAG: AI-2E family transporter [Candidatus Parcubacteria bacterium]
MNQQNLSNIYFWLIPTFLFFLWYIKDIFFILFFSTALGIAIQEWAILIRKYLKIPFFVNIILIYLIFIFILIISIYFLLPVFTKEFKNLYPKIQDFLSDYGLDLDLNFIFNKFLKTTPETVFGISSYFINILGGFFNFFLIIIISFYVATQPNFFPDLFKFIFGDKYNFYINTYIKIKKQFSLWLAGQLFLMIFIGLLTYLVLSVLKIPYAGLISLIAGLLEIVPILGPIIAASLAILITFSIVPDKVFLVMASFVLIQQVENNLLIPFIAKKIFQIKPLITLASILVGTKIGGVLGILTILPLSLVLIELYSMIILNKNKNA